MGLFFTGAGASARKQTQVARAPGKITEAQRKLLTCQQCPLDREQRIHPKMLPTGSARPVFYILGEAPEKQDEEEGRQFAGAAGQFLRERLPGYEAHIRWNNTIRCRPSGNKEPQHLELACCRRLQEQDIEQTKPSVIIGFGSVPLTWVLGSDRQISIWRGRRVPVKIGTHTCWYYPITDPGTLLRTMGEKKKGEAYVCAFERDLHRVFTDYENGLPEPFVEDGMDYLQNIEILQEYGKDGLAAIENALGAVYEQDHAIDIETNGTRPYIADSKILTVAVGTYQNTFAFPWKHPGAKWSAWEIKQIKELLYDYLTGPARKWAHGLRFEMEWFHYEYGTDFLYKTHWGDTMAQAHVLDERKSPGQRGIPLDMLTQLHFGFRIKDQSNVDRKDMEREPLHKVLPYNGMDTKYTEALACVQGDLLEEQGLTHVYDRLNSATRALVTMQAKGVVRNLPAIEQLNKELTAESEKINATIARDKDVIRFTAAGNKFLPTSNPDLIAFFRDYLKIPAPGAARQGGAYAPRTGVAMKAKKERAAETGKQDKYSVDEEALAQFGHPLADLIVQMRSVDKRAGYVTPLLPGGKYVSPDGLVHASYSNLITVSGRLSCEDPNQQNYPRREHKEIRRVVGCPPGHKFVAFDYGQLEARIVAAIANDENLKAEIWNGQDIHSDWTDRIGPRFVKSLWKASRKKVRDDIKQYWTFANFYGNQLDGVAWDLSRQWDIKIPSNELAPFFEEFWARYHGVAEWQKALLYNYWEHGFVATATGQRRHEPMARNELINHPIQGTAGHVVIDAQIRVSDMAFERCRPSLQPVMNIHDDLSFYLPEKTLEEDIEDIAKIMISGSGFDFLTVPLSVEVSVGSNWCDKSELATFTTNRKGEFIELVK